MPGKEGMQGSVSTCRMQLNVVCFLLWSVSPKNPFFTIKLAFSSPLSDGLSLSSSKSQTTSNFSVNFALVNPSRPQRERLSPVTVFLTPSHPSLLVHYMGRVWACLLTKPLHYGGKDHIFFSFLFPAPNADTQ